MGKSKMESESTSVSAFGKKQSEEKSERDDHKGELKYTTGRYVSGHYGDPRLRTTRKRGWSRKLVGRITPLAVSFR